MTLLCGLLAIILCVCKRMFYHISGKNFICAPLKSSGWPPTTCFSVPSAPRQPCRTRTDFCLTAPLQIRPASNRPPRIQPPRRPSISPELALRLRQGFEIGRRPNLCTKIRSRPAQLLGGFVICAPLISSGWPPVGGHRSCGFLLLRVRRSCSGENIIITAKPGGTARSRPG